MTAATTPTATTHWARNQATAAQLLLHLRTCDGSFQPPLSARLDIVAYAAKLADHAERFEAWRTGVLVGVVAVYCNQPGAGVAFVSNVSVVPDCAGQGIAAQLLAHCAEHAAQTGFRALRLEVGAGHQRARALYVRAGFVLLSESTESCMLQKTL